MKQFNTPSGGKTGKCPFRMGGDAESPAQPGGKCPFGHDKPSNIGEGASVKRPSSNVKISPRAEVKASSNHHEGHGGHGGDGDVSKCPFFQSRKKQKKTNDTKSDSFSSDDSSSSDSSYDSKGTTSSSDFSSSVSHHRSKRKKSRSDFSSSESHHHSKRRKKSNHKSSAKKRASKHRTKVEKKLLSKGFDVDKMKKMGYKIPHHVNLNGDPTKCPHYKKFLR